MVVLDDPAVCPLGYICKDGEGLSCTMLQSLWRKNYKIGPLLDGIYCPEGSTKLENCDVGHYCPDPATRLPCPIHKFCPYKTQIPEIDCLACEEGSLFLERRIWGYLGLFFLFLFCIVYSIYSCVRRCTQNADAIKAKLEENRICKEKDAELEKMMRDRMHKLGPKLKGIYERVGLEFTEQSSKDKLIDKSSRGSGPLDMSELFDAIDADKDGGLSFEELNKALQLKDAQLKQFVLEMNTQAGESLDNTEVPKAVFVEYFLEVMEQAAQYDPSPEDAAQLFDELTEAQGIDLLSPDAMIELQGLYETQIALFLNSSQINRMIKTLRKISNENNTGDAEAGSVEMEEKKDGAKITKIDKATFTKNYPFAFYVATEGADEDVPEGVDITFKNLSLNITVGDHPTPVVNGVTGRLKKKTMTALMGGSGAGKTSLLNALCGRAFYGDVTGDIFINGHETSIEKHMDVVGFVPQDDIVYAELTVKENLIFAGKFQLPQGTDIHDIEDLADETMAHLGLTRVAGNLVGDVTRRGVSGGEKKRVNIGLELMSKPAILFLDEPTSGLDSSSAMLVMKGLSTLVEKQGVTVCSVIHQPRKFIFELFDSLILLGVGGNLVYHGAVNDALPYFEALNFYLPAGESVADWLIDISSGSLPPQKNNKQKTQAITKNAKEKAKRTKMGNEDSAKLNRSHLYAQWTEHFEKLDGKEKADFDPPAPFELPPHTKKQSFLKQMWYHIQRNFLVSRRNKESKNNDTMLLVAAVIVVCIMDGSVELTTDDNPQINDEYDLMSTPSRARNEFEHIGEELFKYSAGGYINVKQHVLKLGVIIPVLLGLSASKVLTEKRMEIFRESASGYNLNAYFLAVNITATTEHMLQTLVCAFIAIWMRGSICDFSSSLLNFLMLGWISMSWGLFFPIVVPPKSVVLVISFFMVFFGLLCSGGMSPVEYDTLYNPNRVVGLIAGFLSPSRFFLETSIVQEFRALPPQTGFTLNADNAERFELEYNVFNTLDFGQYNMPNISYQSTSGWYWGALPAFLVGVTIRFAGALSLHICNRSQQSKGSFSQEFKTNGGFRVMIVFLFLCFAGFAAAAAVLMNINWI